jgi:hypothetical protein
LLLRVLYSATRFSSVLSVFMVASAFSAFCQKLGSPANSL